MKCEHCGQAIVGDPTFCASCSRPTRLLATELNAVQTLRHAYNHLQWQKHRKLSLLMAIPLLGLVASFLFLGDFFYYLSLLVFFPILLSPLATELPWHKKPLRFLPFSLLFVAYLFALRAICQGDPILDLVYLIMCHYALSLSLPIVTRVSKGAGLLESTAWSIKKIKESRWQQMFLLWAIFVINALAIIPLGLGLFFSIPFSYKLIARYGQQLETHYRLAR